MVSASPSQLRVRVGVDATFVCRLDGQPATSQQIRWSRPIGVTPVTFTAVACALCSTIRQEAKLCHSGVARGVDGVKPSMA